jgi:hypothetical protein
MAATASFGPLSLADTLSQTSRMNSQFSAVRFSSVAFAVLEVSGLLEHTRSGVVAYRLHRQRRSAVFETLCASNLAVGDDEEVRPLTRKMLVEGKWNEK